MGKCVVSHTTIKARIILVTLFPCIFFQAEHVRVQGYDNIPIGKTVSDVS